MEPKKSPRLGKKQSRITESPEPDPFAGENNSLHPSNTPKKSPRKGRSKSPVPAWFSKSMRKDDLHHDEEDHGLSMSPTPGHSGSRAEQMPISHPSSPSPGRFNRLTKALSSSDANIFQLLKSRLDKHREKWKAEDLHKRSLSRGESPVVSAKRSHSHHHSPSAFCCGHSRDPDSFDNTDFDDDMSPLRSGSFGGNLRHRKIEGGSLGTSLGESFLGGSPNSGNASILTSSEVAAEPCSSTKAELGESGDRDQCGKLQRFGESEEVMAPFHTLSVHLHRGKNLVARDACGSSDPYVKVKIGEKLLYKSRTINRDLNPTWDESFVLPILDLNQQVIFKVFDYDWGMQDDFMGMTSLDPSLLPLSQQMEKTLTLTETNTPGTEYMGELVVTFTLVPRSLEEKDIWLSGDFHSGRMADTQKRLKSQVWSSVLTVLVVEASDLSPGPENYIMDCYVKFRLGNQKYKTRTLPRTTQPKWVEQFDFYLYEGQPQIMEIQVFDETFSKDYIGRVAIDVGLLEKEKTTKKVLKLQEGNGELVLLLTISGTSGTDSTSDLSTYNPSAEDRLEIEKRYALAKSLSALSDVGYLIVKVYEAQGLAALDIGGKSDPFCVLELVNARVQTQTEYRTLNPTWNKIFTFEVKDVTSILELTVYDEDKNHKQEFLGKLNIPLWKIKGGEKKWYMLKDPKLLRSGPGNNPKILLELHMYWNPVRAAIRVLDPPELKYLVPDQRLRRETFLVNIDRLKRIGIAIYDVVQYVETCLEWKYPVRSVMALATYQFVCYTVQPYMIPLCLMLFMLKQWFMSSVTGVPLLEEEVGSVDENIFGDDEDEDKEEDEKKMTLRQKLQAVQDATQTVQNVLGHIASLFESGRNTFRMTVPFISWLIVWALFLITVILYYIPCRYLAMAYGFHKFFRPILRPGVVPTNEVYNILLRVPDNLKLIYYRPLRPALSSSSPKQSTSEKRSPPSTMPRDQGTPSSSSGGKGGGKEPKKKFKFW